MAYIDVVSHNLSGADKEDHQKPYVCLSMIILEFKPMSTILLFVICNRRSCKKGYICLKDLLFYKTVEIYLQWQVSHICNARFFKLFIQWDTIFQHFTLLKISNFEQNNFILHARDKDCSLQHHLHKSPPIDTILNWDMKGSCTVFLTKLHQSSSSELISLQYILMSSSPSQSSKCLLFQRISHKNKAWYASLGIGYWATNPSK